MSQIFRLPDVGEGLTEAEILSWKVSVGDQVSINDILVEVETAKSVVELSSPFEGTVETLHAEEGETVEVESSLVTISEMLDPQQKSVTPSPDMSNDAVAPETTTAVSYTHLRAHET